MVFTGLVFLKRVKDNAPGIYKNTGIAPALTGRTGRHELAAMCLTVLKTSAHKKEAVDFAMYVTNAKNQLDFCKLVTIYPSAKSALSDPYFTRDDGTLETKARILGASQLKSAGRLRPFFLHPRYDLLQQSFDEAMQNACTGKKSTSRAVTDAADEWNKILTSYGD
jgi:putative chitobiose transport system substrate-binding protein